MYADKITDSMAKTIEETNRRRAKQIAYNEEHDIVPQAIFRSKEQIMQQTRVAKSKPIKSYTQERDHSIGVAADPVVKYMNAAQLQKSIEETKRLMEIAAKELDFMRAAELRDEVFALTEKLKEKE